MELQFNKTATACLAHVLRNTPTNTRIDSRHSRRIDKAARSSLMKIDPGDRARIATFLEKKPEELSVDEMLDHGQSWLFVGGKCELTSEQFSFLMKSATALQEKGVPGEQATMFGEFWEVMIEAEAKQ